MQTTSFLRDSGSPKFFNSFRFTNKAVQTCTLVRSGVPRWPFHYFFERNGYLMGNWMDGKRLWSNFCRVFLPGNRGETCFGITCPISVLKPSSFEPRGRVSKWSCPPAHAKRLILVGNNPMFLSFFVGSPLRHSHVLRCRIVSKELHHLNVEQFRME